MVGRLDSPVPEARSETEKGGLAADNRGARHSPQDQFHAAVTNPAWLRELAAAAEAHPQVFRTVIEPLWEAWQEAQQAVERLRVGDVAHRNAASASRPAAVTTAILAEGGEMGARMRAYDWAASPLGPFARWPQSLCHAVDICLHCHFTIALCWGPELLLLYNDGYRPILGEKHPAALGRPLREVFPEIWHIIGPLFQHVLDTGQAVGHEDFLLPLRRHGYVVVDTLAGNPYDLPFALLYLIDETRHRLAWSAPPGSRRARSRVRRWSRSVTTEIRRAAGPLPVLCGRARPCWLKPSRRGSARSPAGLGPSPLPPPWCCR